MEKISGILPASSRVTSVDLKSSGAVRSGTPNYGRPVGLSTAAKREIAAEAKAQAMHKNQMQQRAMDLRKRMNFPNSCNE